MSFSLFTTTVEQILEDVSFALIEKVVDEVLGTAISPGLATVAPSSMAGIYVGAYLLIDTGVSQEQITVTAVTATTFSAVFAQFSFFKCFRGRSNFLKWSNRPPAVYPG